MAEGKVYRLSKIASEFNVGITTIVDFLKKKGHEIGTDPNTKIVADLYALLSKEYSSDISAKKDAERVNLRSLRDKKGTIKAASEYENTEFEDDDEQDYDEQKPPLLIKDTSLGIKTPLLGFKVIGKIDLEENKPKRKDKKSRGKKDGKKDVKQQPQPQPQQQQAQQQPKDAKSQQQKGQQQAKDPKQQQKKQQQQSKEQERKQSPANQQQQTKDKKVETAKAPQEEKPIVDIQAEEPALAVVEEKVVEVGLLVEPEFENELKVVGKIDLSAINQRVRPAKKTKRDFDKERKERTQQYKAALQKEAQQKNKEKSKSKDNNKDNKGKTAADNKAAAAAILNKDSRDKNKNNRERGAAEGQKLDIVRQEVKLSGPTVVGKIDLSQNNEGAKSKKKRKRIHKDKEKVVIGDKAAANKKTEQQQQQQQQLQHTKKTKKKKLVRAAVNEEDVQKQIKETLSRLTSKSSKSKTSKYRRDKRDAVSQKIIEAEELQQSMKNVLKVTEFVSVNELAALMDVPVTQVISTCMNMGLFVSINMRLDAETLALVADEFNFKVEFISADAQDILVEDEDKEEDLTPRSPIVTVMGHVDHGKTKLLDYVRNTNVIAGEAGGITQHIGAYNVTLEGNKHITFLDTPGHEAFTAMRARGAKVTDVVIIVVAADDGVKQQTVEAINHASAAGVPIVFAINKIDKPEANPDRVKEELAQMNYLVEDWGGKYQSQEISAKAGINIDLLLEKVLLEAEMLELKANSLRNATGTIIESALDKGRGYVATVLVQNGTLRTGDVVLAGSCTGNVKAMYNERNQRIDEAGPSMPVLLLGLDGAPQAGDTFNVMENFRDAREIATKRSQLQREQGIRSKKHITLDEIGRRIAIGSFKELNIIVKCDVDGSVEALAGSLIQLSTQEIQVNVIHRAVGQISESDVSLAAASNAIIVGFQVRPSLSARKLAEQEQIDIRIYSIIYDAIEEIKAAMEGMLSPEIKEEISATLEVREVFKISKVGMVAGCIVREGKILRTSRIRIIRDGIVIHTGELGSLKRFKDDVKEVAAGYECGLEIANFNNIQTGDIIEGFVEIEVKRKL